MINKIKANFVQKYMEVDKFVEYCKSNSVEISKYELEVYEKEKFLYPYYRYVIPENEIANNYGFYPDYPYDEAITNGHPLDNCSDVIQPSIENGSFVRWDSYIVDHPDGYKKSRAFHFYANWQIFMVQELVDIHTITTNIVTGHRRGWGILRDEYIPKPKLQNYEKFFQTLSNKIMIDKLLDLHTISEMQQIHINSSEKIDNAKKHFEKFSYQDWIHFLRLLAELYEIYEEKEYIRLKDEVKPYMAEVIVMLQQATDKTYQTINQDFTGSNSMGWQLDDDVSYRPKILKKIFPDTLEEAEKNFLRCYEKDDKLYSQLQQTINYLKNINYEILLLHFYDIDKIYGKRKEYQDRALWSYLRSCVIGIEALTKKIFSIDRLTEVYSKAGWERPEEIRKHLQEKDTIVDAKSEDIYIYKLRTLLQAAQNKDDQYYDMYFIYITVLTRNFVAHKIKVENNELYGKLFEEVYKNIKKFLIEIVKIAMKKENT